MAAYGGDPSWAAFTAEHDRFLAQATSLIEITPADDANPRTVPYWPTPTQMVARVKDPGRLEFMRYMNAWFMRELSQDSHLSWPGLVRRFSPMNITPGSAQKNRLLKYKSDVIATSLVLMLSIMSEIEIELRYGLAVRLEYVWGILTPYLLIAREVYDLRYNGRL